MPRFVVVEDDHLQEGPLQDTLLTAFDAADVRTICTEEEFRAALPDIRQDVPDLVVMDVMLRWADPRPNQPQPPPEVIAGGYYRAGLRCTRLLHEDVTLSTVPVILYTILELSDLERDGQRLPPNASYVGKTADLDTLIRHIRAELRRSRRAQ
jgi:DNA-binding response OmpR family regulator